VEVRPEIGDGRLECRSEGLVQSGSLRGQDARSGRVVTRFFGDLQSLSIDYCTPRWSWVVLWSALGLPVNVSLGVRFVRHETWPVRGWVCSAR
jgi:hypothetical protein